MKYVKLFEQFVAEQDAICEATVMMDALDPHSRDLKKLLKKHNVQMEIGVSGGPGASMGAGTEVTLTGKRSDLEKVLADPMGWDDPDLAEYIEESKSINEAKGDKITIRWSGFSALGADEGRIGTFIVSPKVHSQIEDEFGKEISIDFEDDNVNGKLASFEDVLAAMKQTKYGKIAFKESFSATKSKSINEAVLKPGRDEALANAIIAYFYAVDGTPEGDRLLSMRLNPVRSDIGTRELHKIVGWGKDAIKTLSGAARVPGDFILPNVISVASGKEFYFADNDLVGPDGKNLIMGLNKMSFRDFVDELVKQGVISAPKY